MSRVRDSWVPISLSSHLSFLIGIQTISFSGCGLAPPSPLLTLTHKDDLACKYRARLLLCHLFSVGNPRAQTCGAMEGAQKCEGRCMGRVGTCILYPPWPCPPDKFSRSFGLRLGQKGAPDGPAVSGGPSGSDILQFSVVFLFSMCF